MKKAIFGVCCLMAAGAVHAAEPQPYFGAQYAMAEYDETGFPAFDVDALVLRGGTRLTENFSVEGRFGLGVGDESKSIDTAFGPGTGSVEVDHFYGVYAVGHLPLSNSFKLYGVAGYTQGEVTATVTLDAGGTGSFTADDSGFSYGFGGSVKAGQGSVDVEYMSYLDESGYDITALSVGYTMSF